MPEFDLLLPVVLEGVEPSKADRGKVIIPIIGPGKLGDHQKEFVSNDLLRADLFRDYVYTLIEEAIDYYQSIPGVFPKHKAVVYRDQRHRLCVRLIDRRINEQTLTVTYAPLLEVRTDERESHFLEPNSDLLAGSGPAAGRQNCWQPSYKFKECSMIGGWEKDKEIGGCRKQSLRALKALMESRHPELTSYVAKTVFLHEIRRTNSSDSVWNTEELGNRVVELHNRLLESLKSGRLVNFHTKLLGGEVNVFDQMDPKVLEMVRKRVEEDTRKPSESLVVMVKPLITRAA